jgi:hypothetical protein
MESNSDPHRYMYPVPVRVVRKIADDYPVMDISSTDLACNKGGNVGTNKTLQVNAGSDITLQWTSVSLITLFLLPTALVDLYVDTVAH